MPTNGKPAHREHVILALVARGVFEIDSEGRIWRLGCLKYDKFIPCERKRAEVPNADGYFQVQARTGGLRKAVRVMAHRVVWIHFKGPIPEGFEVNHKNGIKTDNHPDNFELLTHERNMQHARDTGLLTPRKGSQKADAILTEADVAAIRVELKTNRESTTETLAERYGVQRGAIASAASGRMWGHVEEEPLRCVMAGGKVGCAGGVWIGVRTGRCVAEMNVFGHPLPNGCRHGTLKGRKQAPHATTQVGAACRMNPVDCEHHAPVWVSGPIAVDVVDRVAMAEIAAKVGKLIPGWEA